MKEYLIHTVEVLSPKNAFRYSESLRALSLNILNTIVEVSGGVLPEHPALFQLISDNVCHHLVYMLQHTDSPFLLNLILKLFLHLSINMPHQLKIQLELIFNTLMQIVISKWDELEKDLEKTDQHIFGMTKRGKYETEVLTEKDIEELSKEFHTGKMPGVKEVVIEALSALWVRSPYFFINLFKCYDCDFDRTDLTVSLIKLICRLSSSDASVYTTQNVPPICMEGLLALVDGMHDRIKTAAKNDVHINTLEPHPLILQQKKKSDFIECVKQWNKKPAKGLELLYEKGFIKDKNDLEEYAKFLFEKSGRIDKKKLGELLAKPDHDSKKQKGKKKQNTPIG
ncbi:unnamed protein product [Ambrosiozyma monospora]|uniref:Unnamed protein product n=1 Tax=Ambrosiozyma monospora TaxID=43982 RepID=A0A9W6T0V6_AMBMO|nr:unnamed protein product [Ambrosiozyma monospora]